MDLKRATKKERLAEIWKGLSPGQRDFQRYVLAQVPAGESWEPETNQGRAAYELVLSWSIKTNKNKEIV